MNDGPRFGIGRGPLFVERQTYRRRRLMDAARVVPVVGLFLWSIPLLWSKLPEAAVPTSRALLFVFGVWVALIAVAFLISLPLRPVDKPEDQPGRNS
ncbi:hypothetical protein [Pseudoprimorskyibacter insulae]|uniref:Uncharacterized protein n=1 Tax=Pseudoprimorskyibacter insulae TaxID=1695997 RepID=A0A2R8B092_9RHOB|nr:hypothetical protein [Pseudoprimorskyibacter insulae]SPF81554.1 hypothetical protein PRI8871_03378 [Pseudoprimorskyibacter insulae]